MGDGSRRKWKVSVMNEQPGANDTPRGDVGPSYATVSGIRRMRARINRFFVRPADADVTARPSGCTGWVHLGPFWI